MWRQGVDTGGVNIGSNIFKLYNTRSADYGYSLPSGVNSTGVNAQLLLSYEVKENLFVEGSFLMRRWSAAQDVYPKQQTTLATLGLRMNMFRREYDY
jgi:hypothetical protein